MPRRPVAVPGSPVGVSFGDADDIGDVVYAVLTDAGDAERIHEATGPRPLSFAEAVEELAAATGRRIRYLRVSTERDAALLAEQDVPEEVVVRLTCVLAKLLDGRGRVGARRGGARRRSHEMIEGVRRGDRDLPTGELGDGVCCARSSRGAAR